MSGLLNLSLCKSEHEAVACKATLVITFCKTLVVSSKDVVRVNGKGATTEG